MTAQPDQRQPFNPLDARCDPDLLDEAKALTNQVLRVRPMLDELGRRSKDILDRMAAQQRGHGLTDDEYDQALDSSTFLDLDKAVRYGGMLLDRRNTGAISSTVEEIAASYRLDGLDGAQRCRRLTARARAVRDELERLVEPANDAIGDAERQANDHADREGLVGSDRDGTVQATPEFLAAKRLHETLAEVAKLVDEVS